MLTPFIELLEKVQTTMTEQDAEIRRHFDLLRIYKNKSPDSNSSLEVVSLPLPTNVLTTTPSKEAINVLKTESGKQEDNDEEDNDEEDYDDEDYDDEDYDDEDDEDGVYMRSGSAEKSIPSEETYFNRHPGKFKYN